MRFVPYEDVLGIGLRDGVGTMLVPGAGEEHYDTFVADPFEDRKVRREREVAQLLEKLPPDMIMLDPGRVGKVRGGGLTCYSGTRLPCLASGLVCVVLGGW